ncbi:MAG: alpha/beta fold hydrolase [Alphaproteobacteria bacterium]|nr:MAG: alpha/beta fold hydrolase [Alphaproteobacteria bacterium]
MRRQFLALLLALTLAATVASAEGLRDRLKTRMQQAGQSRTEGMTRGHLAGLSIVYWLPEDTAYPAPLVLFSHGMNGCKTQSVFLMKALAQHGYVVVAPDHRDALCGDGGERSRSAHLPEEKFPDYAAWTDRTYRDRMEDIKNLYGALKSEKDFTPRIDWNRVALSGHSLGGYTVLGMAGGWESWKMPGVKAVLALSPFAGPFVAHKTLPNVDVPVMYQSGTRDLGVLPSLKKKGGGFDQTPSPAWFVIFDKVGHFGFTDLQKTAQQRIIDYSLWFLDHTLKGSDAPLPKESGVTALQEK